MADQLSRYYLDKFLKRHDICEPAQQWLDAHKDLTPRQLWEACEDPDWIIWLLEVAELSDEVTHRLDDSDIVRVHGLHHMVPYEIVETMIMFHELLVSFGLFSDCDDRHDPSKDQDRINKAVSD